MLVIQTRRKCDGRMKDRSHIHIIFINDAFKVAMYVCVKIYMQANAWRTFIN